MSMIVYYICGDSTGTVVADTCQGAWPKIKEAHPDAKSAFVFSSRELLELALDSRYAASDFKPQVVMRKVIDEK